MDDLLTPYKPIVVAFTGADAIEYVCADCATYAISIDDNLVGLYDMKTHCLVGVRIENWSKIFVP